MGRSTASDVCKNTCYVGEFDLRTIIMREEDMYDHPGDAYEDTFKPYNGWHIIGEAVPAGLKGRLYASEFKKVVLDKTYKVYSVNTAFYSNGGAFDITIFSDDIDAVTEFWNDFDTEIQKANERYEKIVFNIVPLDTVNQTI